MGVGRDELSDRGGPIRPMLLHVGVHRQGSIPNPNLPSDLRKGFPSSEFSCCANAAQNREVPEAALLPPSWVQLWCCHHRWLQ